MIIKIKNRKKEEKIFNSKLPYIEIVENCSYNDMIFFICEKCGNEGNRKKFKFDTITEFKCKKCLLSEKDRKSYKKIERNSEYYSKLSKMRTKESQVKANKTREKTVLEKYGVENIMKVKDIAKKASNSFHENNKIEDVIKKRKETNNEKYGGNSPMSSDNIKEKVRQANIEKYNSPSPLGNKEIIIKSRTTLIEKYGEQPFSNTEIIKKRKETNNKRYGGNSPMFSDNIKEKVRQTNLTKSLYDIINSGYTPMFDLDDYVGKRENKYYKWKCNECDTEFIDKFNDKKILPRCPKCNPFIKGFSKGENEMLEHCNSINEGIKYRDGLEIDCYIPDKKIGFEFDGLYWHSDKFKANDYHLHKTNYFQEKGIRVYHIFEDEWENKKDIVKSIINTKLNIFEDVIFARKTIIKEVKSKEAKEFQEENHLQGKTSSSINIGLYYEDILVSLMTFGKSRFDKKYQWELVRFVNKKNTKIIGGASKLFKNFIKKYNPSSIVSYSDTRIFDGGLYEVLKFSYSHKTPPQYYYIMQGKRYNRMNFQKKKLVNFEFYDDKKTEKEIMKLEGYNRIYDCGQKVWVWNM